MENVLRIKEEEIKNETVSNIIYKLFWVYIICGVAGFGIETIWCWIDFQEFSTRSSDLFFPISWVWGVGGVMLYLFTIRNRWNHSLYIFAKCTVLGAAFEFLCGYLGEKILEVTFWDYSGMPLHIGRYINIPFCLFWGLLGAVFVAIYTVSPVTLLANYDSFAVVGWGMFVGGIAVMLWQQPWRTPVVLDGEAIFFIGCVIVFGSVLAFTLYVEGVRHIGPSIVGLISSIEPVSAALFTVFWLGVTLTVADLLGFACILLTIVLLALRK